MKKQILFILVILALASFAAVKVLNTKPAQPAHSEHEHGHEEHEHEHGHDNEHKDHKHEHDHGAAARVELSAKARTNAKLSIEQAGPAKIHTLLPLYGKIASNEETLAHVQPRFPGVVKEVHKRLGDRVGKGDLLAVVEGNDSLRPYDIRSEAGGTVIQKDITVGEFVKNEDTLFTIADLSTVWVDLVVFREDFRKLKVGQPVEIHPGAGDESIKAKVGYISPFGTEGTQSMLARCVVPNPNGDLRAGLFVTAEVSTGEIDAAIAVKLAAVQRLKEKTVVFVEEEGAFEAREVALGARDEARVQVLKGLEPGDKYVADNSFILKAEIGKEEAEHEH